MRLPRVVVTGVGPVTALGNGRETFFPRLLAGRSGLRRIGENEPKGGAPYCEVAAIVDTPASAPLSKLDPRPRAVKLGMLAAQLAIEDSRLIDCDANRTRIGVAVGTGIGNLDLVEAAVGIHASGGRPSPLAGFRGFHHAAACEIAREFDFRGPIATLSSGCNSGVDAIGVACDWIRLGKADVVICGGTESELTPGFLATMNASRALQTRFNGEPERASRPYDQARDGNVPGEGAAFLVIESAEHAKRRGARPLAQILGCASRASGARPPYNPFDPPLDPTPIENSLRSALLEANATPAQVSAISSNGSSSVIYDRLEALALANVLGERRSEVPIHSIKGALGQCGAVTSALQVLTACLSIAEGVLPPTLNCDDPDPAMTLDLVRGQARRFTPGVVLTHSIGFGGTYNSSAALGPVNAIN